MGSASALPGFESDATTRLTPSLPFAQVAPPHAAAHPSFSSSPMQMQTPAPASTASNWAADFNRFTAQQQRAPAPALAPARQMSHSPAQTSFQPAFAQPNFASAFSQSVFSPPVGAAAAEPDFDQEMSRWMSAHGAGNMQEVDAAMDQIARELEESEAVAAAIEASRQTHVEALEIGTLSLDSKEPELDLSPAMEQEQELQLEREQLHEPEPEPELEKEPAADAQNSRSAVAEAAEKLLDAVKHESGEKWQNSIFLSLMRDFRDGRKDIVGDEIRSTGGTGETTPAVQPVAT